MLMWFYTVFTCVMSRLYVCARLKVLWTAGCSCLVMVTFDRSTSNSYRKDAVTVAKLLLLFYDLDLHVATPGLNIAAFFSYK